MADKGSFISRFFYKLLEIIGAAVATAVSGYLVAHLGGFLPSQNQAPAAAVTQSERPVAKSTPANMANVPAKEPAANPQPTQSAAAPATAETPRISPTSAEATPSAAPPTPKAASSKTAAKKTGKSAKSEAAAAPTETKPRETADSKTRAAEDKDSVEARVKAALANVDARPPADVPPAHENQAPQWRPGDAVPNTTAAIPSRALESPQPSSGSAGQPRSADLGAPVQQPIAPPVTQSPAAQSPPVPAPVQIAPAQATPPQQPDALTSVEIKSRPIATIDTPATPVAVPPQEEEKGVFTIFKRILPDLRRPASTDEAPRPPAPVGD